MADLPMAQIPNFQLGATPNPNAFSSAMAQTGSVINQTAGNVLQDIQSRHAMQQRQQELDMQRQQQTISQVDTLLKSGMNYPGMLPTFWPAIATRMNSLSPDYQLDPNNPPENLKNFATQLSSISDGLQDKAVSPPQAHAATLQLIQSSFPPKAPNDVGQTAGTPGPQGAPVMQAPPQGQPQGMQQSQSQQQPGGQQPPPLDPMANFLQKKSLYDQANQLIAQAPMEGPQSQEVLRKQLESSSLGIEYKKALDQLATTANAQYSSGQETARAKMAQDQDAVRATASSFEEGSKDFKNMADNFNVFDTQATLSKQFTGAKNTTAAVNSEKTAMLAYAQMAYPGTGRPGNMQMLESMAKSGSLGTLIQQRMNQLDKGEIMTDEQLTGLKQSAFGIMQARENSQTSDEDSASSAIRYHGADPRGFIQNHRPSFIASSSNLFPRKGTIQQPLVGETYHLKIGGKEGDYQLIGKDPNPTSGNWIPANGQ